MAHKDDDITPAILLQHMQGMEQRINAQVGTVEKKVDNLAIKVDNLAIKVGNLEVKVDRNQAFLTMQLDNIVERLDDIEVVQVPTLKKAVGMR